MKDNNSSERLIHLGENKWPDGYARIEAYGLTTRVWCARNDYGFGCSECCTGDRCDEDCTAKYKGNRKNCPHCKGRGWIPLTEGNLIPPTGGERPIVNDIGQIIIGKSRLRMTFDTVEIRTAIEKMVPPFELPDEYEAVKTPAVSGGYVYKVCKRAVENQERKYHCRDCGTEINKGEAECFGICDDCWDKHHPKKEPIDERMQQKISEAYSKRNFSPTLEQFFTDGYNRALTDIAPMGVSKDEKIAALSKELAELKAKFDFANSAAESVMRQADKMNNERNTLQSEYTAYREQAENIAEAYSEAHGVIEGLRARVAELEGALNRLYDHCPLLSDDNFTRDFKNALILAKVALSKTPSEGTK